VSLISGEGAATLAAVAELVISVSIAQRSLLIYGPEHLVAQKSVDKAKSALERALALQSPITLRMTPKAVFLGAHCLERNHPIYRAFAERLWHLGVAAVTFRQGADEEDLVGFVSALNQAIRTLATREQAEKLFRDTQLPHVRIDFLRQLLTHEVKEEVSALPKAEADRQWEGLMGQLAALSGQLPGLLKGGGTGSGGGDLLSTQAHGDRPVDYAGAVIGYLRHLQQVQQQDATLQATEFGKSIAGLIQGINPELRRQLATAALTAPEVTSDELHEFVNLVGYDSLVETLKRFNVTGRAIPPTTFRTLSMLAMVQGEGGASSAGKIPLSLPPPPPGVTRPPDELQRLLDGLMVEDQAEAYAPEEYQRILNDAELRAQRIVLVHATEPRDFQLTVEDGERHFALVANELVEGLPDDRELATIICREAQRSYVRLLETGARSGWKQAMLVSRRALRLSRGGEAVPPGQEPQWVWEQPEILEMLRQRLTESSRFEAEESVDHLVAIGRAAVPLLLEVLATSDSLSARRRALAGLEGLPQSPTEDLVSLLDPTLPWFLHRNIVYILRKRKDPGGATAAKALWRQSEHRVRLEIVAYLLAVEDPDRLGFLAEALNDGDSTHALNVARMVLKPPTRESVTAVIRRAEAIPADQVGMPLHMGLLRALAATRHPQALHYVAEVPARRKPVLPWQRKAFRKEVEAMVENAS
jgi:hypothetical protein